MPSKAVENKTGFLSCSPRLVPHTQTYYINQLKQERWEEKWTNEGILPHPPRGVDVE